MRSTTYLTAAACAAVLLGVTAPAQAAPAAPEAAAGPATAKPAADFNGDGYPDLAVGAPNAKIDGLKRAGLVSIAYGSATGLQYDKQQHISRATPGVPGEPAANTEWGIQASHGDLDGDGYDDLLISDSRSMIVLWGGKDGLSGGSEVPSGEGTEQSPAVRSAWHRIGDVNGDGKADIVGAAQVGPSESQSQWGVGMLYGPFDRSSGKPAAIAFRDTEAEDGVAVSNAELGDMTGDGIDDVVAMGSGPTHAFEARVLKGTRTGLIPGGTIDSRHRGGFGDLNGDGYQDFVGTPQGYDPKYHGGITVTYGGPDGVSKTLPARAYDQDSPGVPGVNEKGDRWGTDIAVADLDKDGYGDIVVGASWEGATDPATAVSGSVTLLRGSRSGVTTEGAKVLTQNSKGVPSTSEKSDHFGEAVTVVDADKNGKPEVYVGGNGEDTFVGRVWQLPTGADGITGTGAKSFNLGGGYGSAHFGSYFAK
ncbi:integrin alpha pat-2 [Streptomyces sp. p1417]|uniref:Integrin alpha pat-2 n=1 Tax=Streptomyces typhae TaxID=2681492 RepID=A0A6L6X2U8_9ACTN|nr:FG-GAP-like repeat-containing protein [Streptomyces typhae]MVO88026.1 integrin alpha pat-2 [Streptomyces typhae]